MLRNLNFIVLITLSWCLTGCLFPGDAAEEHLEKAHSLAAGGYHGAALIEVINALEEEPAHIPALLMLNKLSDGPDRSTQMLTYLLRAKQTGIEDFNIRLLLATSLFENGYFQKSINEINKLYKLANNTEDLTSLDLIKASNLIALQHYPEAKQIYSELVKQPAAMRRAQLGLAKVILQEINSLKPFHPSYTNIRLPGDQYLKAASVIPLTDNNNLQVNQALINAKNHIEQVLEIRPDNKQALSLLAEVQFHTGQYSNAIEILNRILSVDPQDIKSQLLLARVNLEAGYMSTAEQILKQLTSGNRIIPSDLNSINLLGSIFVSTRRPDQALDLIEPFVRNGILDEDLLINLGHAELLKQNPEQAIHYFQQAVDLSPDSVFAHAQLGSGLLTTKNLPAAIKEFNQARYLDSDDIKVNLSLIETCLYSGKLLDALRVAKTLTDQYPEHPAPRHVLGLSYQLQNKSQQAASAWKKALDIDECYAPSRIKLSNYYLAEGKSERAEELIAEGLVYDPGNPDLITELALIENKNRQSDRAIERLQSLLYNQPDHLRARLVLGQLYLNAGMINDALQTTKILKKFQPTPAPALYFSAQVFQYLGNSNKAIKIYQKLLKMEPANPKFQEAFAIATANNGDLDQAHKTLTVLSSKLSDRSLSTLVALTEIALQKNDIKAAETSIKKILKTYPGAPEGYALYGDRLMLDGQEKKAITMYQRGLAKEVRSDIIRKIASAYIQEGNKNTAIRLLKKWRRNRPDDFIISTTLADAFSQTENLKAAGEELHRFLKRQPDHLLILNALARLTMNRDRELAWSYARRAYEISEESPAVLDIYGQLCIARGRFVEGIDALRRAVADAPFNPSYRYHLADGLHQAGKSDLAKKILTTILDKTTPFSEQDHAKQLLAELERNFFN